jgi:hypothetical protein
VEKKVKKGSKRTFDLPIIENRTLAEFEAKKRSEVLVSKYHEKISITMIKVSIKSRDHLNNYFIIFSSF